MHVGTFHALVPGRPGSFASARETLEALADLGVNLVELAARRTTSAPSSTRRTRAGSA